MDLWSVISPLKRGAIAALTLTALVQTAAAAPMACYAPNAQSKESVQKVAMRIVNRTNAPAQITWIDFESKAESYFLLQPGKNQIQDTYATHPWLAISLTGDCMCGHIAEAGPDGKDEWVIEPFEPTPSYTQRKLAGFTVNVSAALVADATAHDPSTAHVERMLADMAAKLPQPVTKALRKSTTLWLERSDCRKPAGEYHVSLGWLSQNNVNPDKTKNVQLNADHLFWTETQPAMMMHEFAHAFHDRFLRYDNPEVLKAFARACASGKYESVGYAKGGKRRAYALNSQTEFFAELTEAYFWRNDFEPFDRAGLAEFDPQSMAMIERMWRTPLGAPNNGDTGRALSCDEATKATAK
jgi:hypothetical protein